MKAGRGEYGGTLGQGGGEQVGEGTKHAGHGARHEVSLIWAVVRKKYGGKSIGIQRKENGRDGR